MAAIFASGSVGVCLHGPDDEHFHTSLHQGMPDHCQAAESVDTAGDGDEHPDAHDHHFCACACHSPKGPTQSFVMESLAVTSARAPSQTVVLATTILPIPYRPPIQFS